MNELTKYVIITTIVSGVYLVGHFGWNLLQKLLGKRQALEYIGKISMWILGITILLLTVGSVVSYFIITLTKSIAMFL